MLSEKKEDPSPWPISGSLGALATTLREIGGIWPPKGIAVLDPREIPFLNTLIPLSSGAVVLFSRSYVVFTNILVICPRSITLALKQLHGTGQLLYDVDEGLKFKIIILAKLRKYESTFIPQAVDCVSQKCIRQINFLYLGLLDGVRMKTNPANPVYSILNSLACPKSKKQVTLNPPEDGSTATSEGDCIKPSTFMVSCHLLLWGEGPSNSEVGSQYTDTPVIDRDLSLVTSEHSDGKPTLAFSTPTGISLGGSSKPLTLSLDHKPLGGWPDGIKLDQQERKHDQSNLVSEAGRE
nr:cytochrome c oxidase subunit 3, mitochondrial [Tanacetum cinerariifolium]